MKKCKKYLLFLLLLPLCFSFSACKKNKDSNIDDGGDKSPDNEITTPTTSYYSVSFDYNLPKEYSYLLGNFEINNQEVGKTTSLASVAITKLRQYFLGWSYKGSADILTSGVTGTASETVELVGNWNVENLEKYYYSDGLEFTIDGDNAIVSNYSLNATNVIIPKIYTCDGVDYNITKIGDNVFSGKSGLRNIIIKADSFSVGDSGFYGTNISSFDFANVTSIGNNAFYGTKFSEIVLNSEISSIGESAFENCTNLTKVDFNNAEIEIKDKTFYNNTKLGTIKNASNLTRLGVESFSGCNSLLSVDFIGSKVDIVGKNAFANCLNLYSAIIPETVTAIHGDVFGGCTKLENLTFSRTYGIDNGFSFNDMFGDLTSSLKTITLTGSTITELKQNYFKDLVNLETFTMCNSITKVADYSFKGCSQLININFSKYIIIDNFSINAVSETKFFNDLVEPFVYEDYQGQKTLVYAPQTISSSYIVPENTIKICKNAFAKNKCLQTISIPSTVSFIGENAFEDCENLTNVTFESNSVLTTISAKLFCNCEKLKSVNISNLTALTEIKDDAFFGVALGSFTIPSTITSIGKRVFMNSKIQSFTSSSANFITQDGVLYKINSDENEVTLLCYPAYKTGDIFICPEKVNNIDVTEVAPYAFANVKYLTKVYFKQSTMEWAVTYNATGNVQENTSFSVNHTILLFAEESTFSCDSISVSLYHEIIDNYEYDFESDEITFKDGFSCSDSKVYIKYANTEDSKYYIVYFELRVETDDGTNNYVVKEGSLYRFEIEFDS